MLFHKQFVQQPGREQLHHMTVARKSFGENRSVMDIRFQKLLVDAAAEECKHRDVKSASIQMIDQIHQHLFRAAMTQIVNQKQYSHHRDILSFRDTAL